MQGQPVCFLEPEAEPESRKSTKLLNLFALQNPWPLLFAALYNNVPPRLFFVMKIAPHPKPSGTQHLRAPYPHVPLPRSRRHL